LRREGARDEARALAERRVAERPGYRAHIALAGVLRDSGDLEASVAQFRAAIPYDPLDPAAYLDIGDLLLDLGRPGDAREAYENVLAAEPEHPWARPSALYARSVAADDGAAEEELLVWSRARRDNARATELATRVWPFVFSLPSRSESSINGCRAARERQDALRSIGVSSFEAPSALWALRAALGEAGRALSVGFAEIPVPDPRDPIRKVPFVCWQFPYEGVLGRLRGARTVEGKPALPAPVVAHAGSIATMAARPFDADDWWRRGRGTVDELGAEAARAAALGCLVHTPPNPRPDLEWWDWMFHVQVAAALVIARLDDGWVGSARRETLLALVDGPVDWVATAGLVGIAAIAERDPAARAGAIEALAGALDLRPMSPVVFMCIMEPCVALLRLQKALPEALAARVRRLHAEYRST
jgi:tetratricopeptide (TPR) repeat protein